MKAFTPRSAIGKEEQKRLAYGAASRALLRWQDAERWYLEAKLRYDFLDHQSDPRDEDLTSAMNDMAVARAEANRLKGLFADAEEALFS